MKKIVYIIMLFLSVSLCSCSRYQAATSTAKQEFLSKHQIIDNLANEIKLRKDKIIGENVWVEYVDMDEDPELELLISYRYEIHKGYFFIYDYKDKDYKKVFNMPWAVEKMSGHEVIYAQGNNEIHQLTANIIHMELGRVYILWSGIIDRYDYTNPYSGNEIHGFYYVDTNADLHYCYKIEKTDKDAKVLKKEFKEELFVWDKIKRKYIRP